MINPRKTFRESDVSRRWLDVVDGPQFQAAVNAALLEMSLRQNSAPDMATAAAYQWRMDGAKQFLSILMNLTVKEPDNTRQTDAMNLNHRA